MIINITPQEYARMLNPALPETNGDVRKITGSA